MCSSAVNFFSFAALVRVNLPHQGRKANEVNEHDYHDCTASATAGILIVPPKYHTTNPHAAAIRDLPSWSIWCRGKNTGDNQRSNIGFRPFGLNPKTRQTSRWSAAFFGFVRFRRRPRAHASPLITNSGSHESTPKSGSNISRNDQAQLCGFQKKPQEL